MIIELIVLARIQRYCRTKGPEDRGMIFINSDALSEVNRGVESIKKIVVQDL